MKIKTEELIGLSLDYAVAIAEGIPARELYPEKYSGSLFRRMKDEDGKLDGTFMTGPDLLFSRKWEAGGPIIEREGMCTRPTPQGLWEAWEHGADEPYYMTGPTLLTAAMRCYVASRLGEEVEIPKELI